MATLAARDESGTLQAQPGEVELTEKRTRTAKVFRLGGNRYRVGASLGPVHYRRDPFDEAEDLKEIDLSTRLTPGADWYAACETNGYQVRLWQSRGIGEETVRYIAQFRRAGHWFEMAPVAVLWMNDAGEQQVIGRTQAVGTPTIDNDQYTATWADAFGRGLDFRYNLSADKFYKCLIVRERSALPTPTIDTTGLRLVLVMSVSWDEQIKEGTGFCADVVTDDLAADVDLTAADETAEDREYLLYEDATRRTAFCLQTPLAWDSGQESQDIPVHWRLARSGTRCQATFSIEAEPLTKATYPVYIDTAIGEEQVGASADDAWSYAQTFPNGGLTNCYTNSSYTNLGASASLFYHSGYRFQTVPIPAGATVESATLSFCSYTNGLSYPMDVEIFAEDVDDASEWDTSSHTPGTAYSSRTSASVRWHDDSTWTANTWYGPGNLSALVQEVIDRPGWASGQDMNFMAYNYAHALPASNEYKRVRHWDGDSAKAAKFNCTYITAQEYDETGKSETVDLTQAESESAVRSEARSQTVALAEASDDVAQWLASLSETVLATVVRTDGAVWGESQASQTVIVTQGRSEAALLAEERAQALALSLSSGQTAQLQEATSTELLLALGRADAAVWAEAALAQALHLAQDAASVGTFTEPTREQLLKFLASHSAGNAYTDYAEQVVSITQAAAAAAVLAERDLSDLLLLSGDVDTVASLLALGGVTELLVSHTVFERQAEFARQLLRLSHSRTDRGDFVASQHAVIALEHSIAAIADLFDQGLTQSLVLSADSWEARLFRAVLAQLIEVGAVRSDHLRATQDGRQLLLLPLSRHDWHPVYWTLQIAALADETTSVALPADEAVQISTPADQYTTVSIIDQ